MAGKASDDLRGVMGDGPPFDEKKVIEWFNERAHALLVNLITLEDFFQENFAEVSRQESEELEAAEEYNRNNPPPKGSTD